MLAPKGNQELPDAPQGTLSCYFFRGRLIELNCISEIKDANLSSQNQLWQAFIHSGTSYQTVLAVGIYPNRIEAALKAEQLIRKWESFKNSSAT